MWHRYVNAVLPVLKLMATKSRHYLDFSRFTRQTIFFLLPFELAKKDLFIGMLEYSELALDYGLIKIVVPH